MRFTSIVLSLSLATVVPLVVAQPHRHQHHHAERRSPDTEIVDVPGPTVILYELNGKMISKDEVDQGLKDGTLVLVGGSVAANTPSASSVPSSSSQDQYTPPSSPTPSSTSSSPPPPSFTPTSAYESASAPASSSSSSSSSSTSSSSAEASPSASDSSSSSSDSGSPSGGQGVDRDFPDGEIDCSHFPSDYGAIDIEWEHLGGWAGLQKVTYSADGSAVTNIETEKSGPCGEGMMCSYACPPGYLKAQWPEAQGATGQSVGGIECKNGKLYLPRASETKKLCMAGTGGVKIHNQIGQSVPVCRTDYPGTESMTIPATLDPATSDPYDLSCPNEDTYYQWEQKKTSAQYYVNPAGTSLADGCTWNQAGSDKGNWAPVNLGVGKTGGTWLSIMANAPTNPDAKLGFKIEIVGDNLGGSCRYEDGQYWQTGVANDKGCTVEVMSGEGTFNFH